MSIKLSDLTQMNEPGSTPITNAIKQSMAAALAEVPDDKRGAALAYADTDGNVHGVVALKLGDQWHLWANADYHTQTKDFSGSVGVKFTW